MPGVASSSVVSDRVAVSDTSLGPSTVQEWVPVREKLHV